jgi:hypothetical protein
MSHEEVYLPIHDMRTCICIFMSWENAWRISHWLSSHLTVSSNQCLFMSHEKMHRKSPIGHLIDHFIISPSICPFTCKHIMTFEFTLWQIRFFQNWVYLKVMPLSRVLKRFPKKLYPLEPWRSTWANGTRVH